MSTFFCINSDLRKAPIWPQKKFGFCDLFAMVWNIARSHRPWALRNGLPNITFTASYPKRAMPIRPDSQLQLRIKNSSFATSRRSWTPFNKKTLSPQQRNCGIESARGWQIKNDRTFLYRRVKYCSVHPKGDYKFIKGNGDGYDTVKLCYGKLYTEHEMSHEKAW